MNPGSRPLRYTAIDPDRPIAGAAKSRPEGGARERAAQFAPASLSRSAIHCDTNGAEVEVLTGRGALCFRPAPKQPRAGISRDHWSDMIANC